MLLAWSAPTSDGGAEITSYKLKCNEGSIFGTGFWTSFVDVAALSNSTIAWMTGLRGNTLYTCAVTAFNSLGFGEYGASRAVHTAPIPPSVPGQPNITAVSQYSISLVWDPPAQN